MLKISKEKLYVKFSKCKFWFDQVVLLGHVVNNEGIAIDPTKIEGTVQWPHLLMLEKFKVSMD